jgi:hypothetical protein
MRPSPSEIDAVIADMIAAEAAQVPKRRNIHSKKIGGQSRSGKPVAGREKTS